MYLWYKTNSFTLQLLDMTGRPGILKSILWSLGRKHKFPRLLVFLQSYTKFFVSFSDIDPFLLSFRNITSLYQITKHFVTERKSLQIFLSPSSFSASDKQSSLSNTTTRKPWSAFLITIDLSSASDLIAGHSILDQVDIYQEYKKIHVWFGSKTLEDKDEL